ncbi:MAG: hypothetical protein WKF97_23490, partial [Chitinophagaceae bacterium]
MKKTLILLSGILINQICFSQFNDTTHYFINYASSGIINKTNDRNAFILTNNLRFNVNKKTLSVNSTSSWTYGRQNSGLTNNDFSSTLDFSLFKHRRFYYWGLLNYDKSYSINIKDRLQNGLGISDNIINRKKPVL